MIRRTLIRDLPNRSRIIVRLELRDAKDPGSLSPAFSVTADVYEAHGTHSGKSRHVCGCEPDRSGCQHEATLEAFPELAPLVALHLADPVTGEPMHAEDNGLYFYRTACGLSGGWSDDYGYAVREGLSVRQYAHRAASRCLRLPSIPLGQLDNETLPAAFRKLVERQRERWQQEAAAGRAQLQAIPTLHELLGADEHGNEITRRIYPNCISPLDSESAAR